MIFRKTIRLYGEAEWLELFVNIKDLTLFFALVLKRMQHLNKAKIDTDADIRSPDKRRRGQG